MCNFSKTSPTESGESSEKSSGENRVKSCHVCGCHGVFGPDIVLSKPPSKGRNRHLTETLGELCVVEY